LILIICSVTLATAGSFYLWAKPNIVATPAPPVSFAPVPVQSATPSEQPTQPTIVWDVPELALSVFPGSSATATATFESNKDLSGIIVAVSPSLGTIVTASPAALPSVIANQPYQITFTFIAPPKFVKRSFGGTVQVRNAGIQPNVFATPLTVNLNTDWNAVSPDNLFSLDLPLGWQINEVPSSGTHTFAIALPDGTTAGWLYVYTPQQWTSITESDEAPVLLSHTTSSVYAYGDSEALSPDEINAATEFAHALASFKVK
jgi:hypothetical protein